MNIFVANGPKHGEHGRTGTGRDTRNCPRRELVCVGRTGTGLGVRALVYGLARSLISSVV